MQQLWEARFVVNASGRDTFLANRFQHEKPQPVHSSSAVFGHFKGAVRRPGRDEGNISVYCSITAGTGCPLRDGAMERRRCAGRTIHEDAARSAWIIPARHDRAVPDDGRAPQGREAYGARRSRREISRS